MIKAFRPLFFIFVILLFAACGTPKTILTRQSVAMPKREFRGAWIQTVGQSRYQHMNSAEAG